MSVIEPGSVIADRYELGRQLGTGGMARVYLARDRKLGREVAVKVLAERYAADPSFVERFRREATSAAGLNHPNIVAVYDRGEVDGSYFIVMEYLPGHDLKREIRERAPISSTEAIDIELQLLSALAAAHKRDVIHRDVKPQNVMFTDDGRVKVTDFGIARAGGPQMTEVGLIIGTAQYLSPEQAQGKEVTPASDCYSAGIVLYEMLTGRLPFDGDRPVTVALKQVNETPQDPRVFQPDIPPRLAAVVMRALEKRPEDRFMHAEDFTRALQRVRAEIIGDDETMLIPGDGSQTRVMPGPEDGPAGDTSETRMMRQPTEPTRASGPSRREPPGRNGLRVPAPRRRRFPVILAWLVGLGVLGGLAWALIGRDSGPAKVPVPVLQGKLLSDARDAVLRARLEPKEATKSSTTVDKGTVISSDPPTGQFVDEGSTVTLLVSAGPASSTVPDVVGMQRAQAVAAVKQAGFENRKVVEEFDKDLAKKGLVIKQDPPSSEQPIDTVVTITVSKGPKKVAVPDIRKIGLDAAKAKLASQNLRLGTQTSVPRDDYSPGTVINQEPGPTTSVDEGSAVNVVLAAAPEATMPSNLVGLTPTVFKQKLKDAGLDNTVTSSEAEGGPNDVPGTVIGYTPSGGSPIKPGDRVTIVVAAKPLVAVPTVIGDAIAVAQGKIKALGLQAEVVRRDPPNGEPPEVVWGSDPVAGTDVDGGSVVQIFAAPELTPTGTTP